ncbi:MAG: type II toxin-antitoxin system VapC family toxin [Thermoanaerobaculia bacterium]
MEWRYWDSSVFLAWLLPEPDRRRQCREVLTAAERGDVNIITSAITLTEVIKLKGKPPLRADQHEKIRRFFQNDYIKVVDADRFIAEDARRLIWNHGLQPKDSIHVATALRLTAILHWKAPRLDCYDGDLIALSGKLGSPPLTIDVPSMPQPPLPFDEQDAEENEDVDEGEESQPE